jgi:hypothetical protein
MQALRRAGVGVELVVHADTGRTFDDIDSANRFHDQVAARFSAH